MHKPGKAIPFRSVFILFFLLCSLYVYALDSIAPKKAKSSIQKYNSYSWDLKAGGWVELADIKTVTENYDSKDRIIERDVTYDKGKLLEKTVYKYFKEGFEKTTYSEDGKVTRFSKVETDGRERTETVYFPDKSVYAKIVSVIGEFGAPESSEESDSLGKVVWRINFRYDDKGNCTTATYRNPDGSIAFESSFEYGKQDSMGNWIERTEYCTYADVGSREKDVARRTIEYETEK